MKIRMMKLLALMLVSMFIFTACSSPEPEAPAVEEPAEEPTEEPAAEEEVAVEGWVPTEDVEFIIPFGAGGGSDVFARKIVEIISRNNMAPVNFVATNKPGGSGVVGYTYMNGKGESNYIMATTSSSFYSQPLTGNSPLSITEDFEFVAHMAKDPSLFAANADLGFTTLEEMVEYAKANPGDLKYGGTGNVSDDAILMYMVNELAGIELVYVPYDSGADVLAAILGGHIDVCAISPSEGGEHLETGALVPLAVSSDDRVAILPDVPTFTELGFDITHQQSRGVVMNGGTPVEVLDYYSDLFQQVSETEEWQTFLSENVMGDVFYDNEEYVDFNADLTEKYIKFMDMIERNQ